MRACQRGLCIEEAAEGSKYCLRHRVRTSGSGKPRCVCAGVGFCQHCHAPGLTPVLTKEEVERIDTFAAHWVQDSNSLIGLANALKETIERYIKADRREAARNKSGYYDHVPE